jgi:hypothetical protein
MEFKQNKASKKKQPKQAQFSRPTTAFKHKRVLDNLAENGGSMRKAIIDAGYSQEVANNPSKITESKTWGELMEAYISDNELATKHKQLLNATRMDHMVFPMGPVEEEEQHIINDEDAMTAEMKPERTTMTDVEIVELLASVNCTVRKIVHGRSARHVYFWAADNKSQKDAIEMGYKLKGRFIADQTPPSSRGNTYNIIFSAPVQEKVKAIEAELKNILTIKPNEPTI